MKAANWQLFFITFIYRILNHNKNQQSYKDLKRIIMIKKLFKVMVLGAILTTTGAYAQEAQQLQDRKKGGQRDPQEMFNKLDADKDGKLSPAEVEQSKKGKLKENFIAIDTNKDSFLDKEELMAYRKEQMAKRKVNRK